MISVQLPQGPEYDSYRIYLFVNIIDDSGGITVYKLVNPIYVYPNKEATDQVINEILDNNPRSLIVTNLNSGNLKTVTNFVSVLSTQINMQNMITPSSSVNQSNNDTLRVERENNAILREMCITKVTELSISDLSSIKLFASALSTSTSVSSEISRASAVSSSILIGKTKKTVIFDDFSKKMAVEKCTALTSNLIRLSKKSSLESVKDGAYGIIDSLTNSLIVCFRKDLKNFFMKN